jgi:hypothetical protein
MKSLIHLAKVLVFGVSAGMLGAQSGDIDSSNDPVAYNVSAATLRAVPFKNISYDLDDYWVTLRGGTRFQKSKEAGGTETRLERLWLFDFKDGVAQHALVWITHMECGVSCSVTGYAFVFELRNGKLVQVQKFEFDGKDGDAGVKFDGARNTLTITGKSGKDASDCCASFLDVDTFAWKDGAFKETAHRQVRVNRS